MIIRAHRIERLRHAGQAAQHLHVRLHATVMFTDIEDSTAHLVRMGDDAWTRLLDEHDRTAARLVRAHGGRLIKTTGDGVLALFSDARLALECARRFIDAATGLGITVRTGLHSGECVIARGDVSGLTVHIAARVARLARGGEVRISQHTLELLADCADEVTDCGYHRLKGIPGEWRLFVLGAATPGRLLATA